MHSRTESINFMFISVEKIHCVHIIGIKQLHKTNIMSTQVVGATMVIMHSSMVFGCSKIQHILTV